MGSLYLIRLATLVSTGICIGALITSWFCLIWLFLRHLPSAESQALNGPVMFLHSWARIFLEVQPRSFGAKRNENIEAVTYANGAFSDERKKESECLE